MAGKAEEAAKLVADAKKASEADKVDEAISTAKSALAIYRELGEGTGMAAALTCLLTCQLSKGEVSVEEAVNIIREDTLKIKRVGGKKGEAAMNLATAEVYMAVGESDKALKLALDAQAVFAKEGDALKEAEAFYKVIVDAYIGNANEEKALTAANQALSLAQREADKTAEACAWLAAASARSATGAVEDAIEAASKALALFKEVGNKYKETETQRFMAMGYLANGDSQAAMSSAKDALAGAKDIGSGPLAASAAEMIVEANIMSETPQEGLTVAEEELAALEKSGKTAGVASMMSAVIVATTAVKGANAGFETVKKFVESCRASGNKFGEVAMLHRMACMAEYPDVALNTAQAALKLAQKIGDAYEELKIKHTLTELWVAKGKLDKAPTRKQALALLNELSRDLEKKDAEKFEDTNKKLNKYLNALTQTDFEATLYKVISKKPDEYMDFLKEHGLMAEEKEKKEGPVTGHKFRPVPVPNLYMGFRIGGLGYGPRYRVCTPANKILHDTGAMGVVNLQDCSDDWERELGYSPSLLDGCLQTGAAMGH
mmetsp:Transcript_74658/g.241406  ORF Transcript_74658/g.241406 Transcript_74658/m.241406 type:complete len:547 (-) Transcript_74658:156-1796(-)